MAGFFRPEDNCWRIERAGRLALLIDSAAYYATLRQAALRAERSILIVGWDIDSRTRLLPEDPGDGLPVELGPFLNALVARRRGLYVHILTWDFAMIYALERDLLPLYRLQWYSHRRVCLHLDDCHPVGASHHQKLVVIDDRLAFVGGLDITKCRWDTPEHQPHDPRRRTVAGEAYAPFHDVQMLVDGPVAAALGELARARWRQARGRRLPRRRAVLTDPWPANLTPELTDITIAIARTAPAYAGRPAVTEIRNLLQQMLAAAQRFIYIENQYLTSATVGDALSACLQAEQGPEVVLVLPYQTGGWLEQATMDVLRARLLARLRAADHYGRLRVYYPFIPGLPENECVIVHSKLLIVDDTYLLLGSANLSNRSLGLDTECDLAIAADDPASTQALRHWREQLLGEHLGVEPAAVAAALTQTGDSLIAAIEQLRSPGRSLRELDGRVSETLERTLPDAALIDPEQPLDAELLTQHFLDERAAQHPPADLQRVWLKPALAVVLLLGLLALWRWTPLKDWLNQDTLTAWAETLDGSVWGHLTMIGALILASITAFPIVLLIVVTALVFGPWLGFVYALTGSLLGAVLAYGIGYSLGRNTVRRLAGERINRLSQALAKRGLVAVAVIRLLPIAPFAVVNMVAGAAHIRLRDYVLGTLLGMGPGMLGLTVFADSVADVVRDPEPVNFIWLALVAAGVGTVAFFLHRWLERRGAQSA